MPIIELSDADKARLGACGCSQCVDSIVCPACAVAPRFWKVTVAGVIDDSCTDCESLNGEYIIEFNPVLSTTSCVWDLAISRGCAIESIRLTLSDSASRLAFYTSGGPVVSWGPDTTVDCFGANTFSARPPSVCGIGNVTFEPA